MWGIAQHQNYSMEKHHQPTAVCKKAGLLEFPDLCKKSLGIYHPRQGCKNKQRAPHQFVISPIFAPSYITPGIRKDAITPPTKLCIF